MHTTSEGEKSVFSDEEARQHSCLHPRSSSSGCEKSRPFPHLRLCSGGDLSSREKLLVGAGRSWSELGAPGGKEGWVLLSLPFLVIKQELVFSGIMGSGLCVFSKHPVQEITQHVYSLNGYPYMVRVSPLPLLTQTGRSLPGALAGGLSTP